jgi:rare lipoprotein A (peptidoglycan hydrolase)
VSVWQPLIKQLRANSAKWLSRVATATLLLFGFGAILQAKADPRIDRDTAAALSSPTAPQAAASPDTVVEEHGVASWYGRHWRGRRTASGGRFDDRELTAAHLWLPFSTKARITNLDNGRSVDVVVTDRGPYIGGRIIDLSARAAQMLGMSENGLAPVAIVAEFAPERPHPIEAW